MAASAPRSSSKTGNGKAYTGNRCSVGKDPKSARTSRRTRSPSNWKSACPEMICGWSVVISPTDLKPRPLCPMEVPGPFGERPSEQIPSICSSPNAAGHRGGRGGVRGLSEAQPKPGPGRCSGSAARRRRGSSGASRSQADSGAMRPAHLGESARSAAHAQPEQADRRDVR